MEQWRKLYIIVGRRQSNKIISRDFDVQKASFFFVAGVRGDTPVIIIARKDYVAKREREKSAR